MAQKVATLPHTLKLDSLVNTQRIGQRTGKILVSKTAKAVRACIMVGISFFFIYGIYYAASIADPLVMFASIMPITNLILLSTAWYYYRNPLINDCRLTDGPLVSVIIPVYNQRSMIELVIEAIFRSTYTNFELVIVNDGSNDGSKEILEQLAHKYPKIKLIHKKNAGKRKAVGTGFTNCTGKHVILIDSDSIVDRDAIRSLVEALESDNKIGAVVGNAKPWNANRSWLTRFQSVWYDYSFNIHKSYESYFGLVQCCSGCMSAYRREAIIDFIPIWMDTNLLVGDDRQLTSLVHAKSWAKKELVFRFAQKTFNAAARYDDAEDRLLTAQAMIQWKTVYAASAVVYTDVPETMSGYWKQQLRWRRGYLRVQFFVASFIWQNNPIVSFIFYVEFMSLLTMPLLLFTMFVYMPLIVGDPGYSIYFFVTTFVYAAAEGLDTRFRNKGDKNWKYRPFVVILLNFLTGPLLLYALLTIRTNKWGTR